MASQSFITSGVPLKALLILTSPASIKATSAFILSKLSFSSQSFKRGKLELRKPQLGMKAKSYIRLLPCGTPKTLRLKSVDDLFFSSFVLNCNKSAHPSTPKTDSI